MDRHPLRQTSLLELPDEDGYIAPDESAGSIKSAKIDELAKYLQAFDENDKTLVFSQFTSFLDHVGTVLRERDINYCRFDGSMSAQKVSQSTASNIIRTTAYAVTEARGHHSVSAAYRFASRHAHLFEVRRCRTQSDRRIERYLGTLSSSFSGTKLTFSKCDPWWQSAIEAQAIDRVHRVSRDSRGDGANQSRWDRRRQFVSFSSSRRIRSKAESWIFVGISHTSTCEC